MDHPLVAAQAGPSSPERDEAQAGANGSGSKGQDQGDKGHSADFAVGNPHDCKAFATLQARAALAGFELVRMADGSLVVARWTMTRALADLAAAEAFLQQVGAA